MPKYLIKEVDILIKTKFNEEVDYTTHKWWANITCHSPQFHQDMMADFIQWQLILLNLKNGVSFQ